MTYSRGGIMKKASLELLFEIFKCTGFRWRDGVRGCTRGGFLIWHLSTHLEYRHGRWSARWRASLSYPSEVATPFLHSRGVDKSQ